MDPHDREGPAGDEGHEGRVGIIEGEMDRRVGLKRGRVLGVVRFKPRSWTTLPSPSGSTKSTMLSIAIRIASFVGSPSPPPRCSLVVSPTMVPPLSPKVSGHSHLPLLVV